MHYEEEYGQMYEKLNPEQKRAVDTIEGPVMVVAGPGTGKTQILTVRIANILRQTDTEPENILALTFTDAAAINMRKRLGNMIGPDAHRVMITTFHSFANDVIQENPDDFPNIIGSQPMTEVDQIEVIQKIILDTQLDYLKPFGDTFFYVRSIRAAISDLKREGVTPAYYADLAKKEQDAFNKIDDLYYDKGAHEGKMKGKYQDLEKKIHKNIELATVYQAYQDMLHTLRRYDFSDMIMETKRAFEENPDLLLRMQEQYHYVLVDEHQDTNNAQNELLNLLMNFHASPNLFVVGDHKQAIYRFQGANAENFSYFKERYPDAELIVLRQNYRSTKNVLQVAESLLAGDEALQSNREEKDTKPITVAAYLGQRDELYSVGKEIKDLMRSGVEPSEIAILYRNNRDAGPISQVLIQMGVDHQIESDADVASHPIARQLVSIARSIAGFGEDETLAKSLHLSVVGADPLDVVSLIRCSQQKRKYSLYDCLKDPKKHCKDIINNWQNPLALSEWYSKLENWVQQDANNNLATTLEDVVRQSGLLQEALSDSDPELAMKAIELLYDEAHKLTIRKPDATIKDFVLYLDTLQEQNISLKLHTGVAAKGKVRLMTAHRSKGLEFDHVFIIHAHDGNWGNKTKRNVLPLLDIPRSSETIDDDQNLADERRLFYVGITRARKHVHISYHQFSLEGREQLKTVFIDEINPELLVFTEPEVTIEDLKEIFTSTEGSQKNDSTLRDRIQQWITQIMFSQGLSVSALNNYLSSPWQFFFRNLVRIPSAPNKHQAYGLAIHGTLQRLFNALREGEHVSEKELHKIFEQELEKQYIPAPDVSDTLTKGEKSLSAWYQANHKNWNVDVMTEFRINGVNLPLKDETIELLQKLGSPQEDIRLTGILDKVERDPEFSNRVTVVDYKTGNPKTRNEVMGNTKSSNGDYYRQLVFYKLLLSHFADGQYHMDAGVIDFVEPDNKGKLHREAFEISDEEVEKLAETIQDAVHEIVTLGFWGTECDEKTCDYCDLVANIKSIDKSK